MIHFGNGKSSQHCVHRCESLMSLKHPEMLELPVKRLSVLSTERKGRQCGSKEAYVGLRTIAKQKVYAEFDLATHRRQQQNTNTRFGCRQIPKYSSGMV